MKQLFEWFLIGSLATGVVVTIFAISYHFFGVAGLAVLGFGPFVLIMLTWRDGYRDKGERHRMIGDE